MRKCKERRKAVRLEGGGGEGVLGVVVKVGKGVGAAVGEKMGRVLWRRRLGWVLGAGGLLR